MFFAKLIPNRVTSTILLGLLCIVFTLSALYMLSNAALMPQTANAHFITFLSLALGGLTTLVIVIVWQIIALYRRLNRNESGARLSWSFALAMLITTSLPLTIIAFFAWQFLSYDLDQTFNSRLTHALDDALQLSRRSIAIHARQTLDDSKIIAAKISHMKNNATIIANIEPLRRENRALELALFDASGRVLAFSNVNLEVLNVIAPNPQSLNRLVENNDYFEFALYHGEYIVRLLQRIKLSNNENIYLQAIFAMPDSFNSLVKSVRDSYEQHKSYNYLQPHITASLIMVLTLILVLSILITLWSSVLFGEHMTRPLRILISATRKVAEGDFSVCIKNFPKNELGILSATFNEMSAALDRAQKLTASTQRQLTEQKTALEVIMDNISGGIITLHPDKNLISYNKNAEKILDCQLQIQQNPKDCARDIDNAYQELLHALLPRLDGHEKNWQQEVTLQKYTDRKVLMCHGGRIPLPEDKESFGHVVAFDDITHYIQIKRNDAWEEVARRLAHEIKNPLTPIRLQAERLRHKLQNSLSQEKEISILNRATDTIINQVETMKNIVSDFSQYAKVIELRCQNLDLHALLKDFKELYREQRIELDLSAASADIEGDVSKLQQVLHNLIKNAIESQKEGADVHILCSTFEKQNNILLTIEDNGSGFLDLANDPFEPYVTTKEKGTGLGLAIVKKIIQEHQGQISVGHSNKLGGAKISIVLPFKIKKIA